MPAVASRVNDFHMVRRREMNREQQCLAGANPADIPPMYFTPTLCELCARTIAENFETMPDVDALKEIDPELYNVVIDQLRTDLSLEVTVPRIHAQSYWKSCCEARWSSGQLSEYAGTSTLEAPEKGGWRRVFLQRHLAEYLMTLEESPVGAGASHLLVRPGKTNIAGHGQGAGGADDLQDAQEKEIAQLTNLCGNDIYSLDMPYVRCHFDVFESLSRLPHLEELRLTYSVLNAGITFKREMVGFRQSDALSFQRLLKNYPPLTILKLPGNKIDSSLLKAMLVGMVRNTSIVELDLSHNLIDDDGIGALSIILMKRDASITKLDLANNSIRADGARSLGKALAGEHCKIAYLNLRMNRLGDDGGERLFRYTKSSKTLEDLNVSCNALGAQSAEALLGAVQGAGGAGGVAPLKRLDISGNALLGEEGGRLVVAAVNAGKTLTSVDVRMCGMSAADVASVNVTVRGRGASLAAASRRAVEAEMDEDIRRLVEAKVKLTHGV